MKLKNLYSILIIFFGILVSAQNDEFFPFGKTEDGEFSYSLSKLEDNKFLILTSTGEISDIAKTKMLTAVVIATRCIDRKYKYVTIGEFDDDGELGRVFNQSPEDFASAYPGTVNEKLLKFACGGTNFEIENFKIIEDDLLPKLYLDMHKKAEDIARNYKEKNTKTNSSVNSSKNNQLEPKKDLGPKSWIDYYEPQIETGDFGCSNIIPQYDTAIENKLLVTNKGNTDVVVKIMNIENEKAIRLVYIKEGEQISIKNIPQGRYYLKEAYGKKWKQKNVDGKCIGEFSERAVYKKGQNIADFNIKKTETSTHENFQIPSYSLEIGVTFSKSKTGKHITDTISSSEFNK